MKRVTLGNHSMIVLGTVQGLVKERLKVRTAFEDIKPDVVALPISDEMLEGLEAVVNGEVREVATNSIDDLFAEHLKRFGEVQLPPPSLVEAYRLAKESGAEIVTLDMSEEDYAEAYVKNVSGYHFWKRIWNLSKLSKKTFAADTPEEFVVAWDAYVSRLKGYKNLEQHREGYMAKRALKLLRKNERSLVLVEYERMEGVAAGIQKGALEPYDEEEDEEEKKSGDEEEGHEEKKSGDEEEGHEEKKSGDEGDGDEKVGDGGGEEIKKDDEDNGEGSNGDDAKSIKGTMKILTT